VRAGLEHYADTGQLSEEELERMYARADVDHDGQVRGSTTAPPLRARAFYKACHRAQAGMCAHNSQMCRPY
jgi:hypothetical protein